MNVNNYGAIIKEQIRSNNRISSADKKIYESIFCNVKPVDESKLFLGSANTYSNHYNQEDIVRAHDMVERKRDSLRVENQQYGRQYMESNQDITVTHKCSKTTVQTLPVPPDYPTTRTLSSQTLEKSITQKEIFCAMQNPELVYSYAANLENLQFLGAGKYGAGFRSETYHDLDNEGTLVKMLFSQRNDYSARHEIYASYIINNLMPLSQNFVFTYGSSYSASACKRLLSNSKMSTSKGEFNKLCTGTNRVQIILSEFVPKSKILWDWINFTFPRIRTAKDVQDVLDVYMQTIGAISYLCNISRSIHNDLHSTNVLIEYLDEPIELRYYLPSGKRMKVRTNRVVRIIDYGFISYIDKNGVYITQPALEAREAFTPATDVYYFTTILLQELNYMKNSNAAVNLLKNIFANVIIHGIYGRKGVDTKVTSSILGLISGDSVGNSSKKQRYSNLMVPNWGKHSNIPDATPAFFDEIIGMINKMITADHYNEHYPILAGTSAVVPQPYSFDWVSENDLTFLRYVANDWASYQQTIRSKADKRDRISQDGFIRGVESAQFQNAADKLDAGKVSRPAAKKILDEVVRPLMIMRIQSQNIGNKKYRDAVEQFENVLIQLYNILPGTKMLVNYFELTGLLVNV